MISSCGGRSTARRAGALYLGAGAFETDRIAESQRTIAELWAAAANAGGEQVYTCAPPGSGARLGLDRDEDGHFDRDELDAGTSPVDPIDYPGGPQIVTVPTSELNMRDATVIGRDSRRRFKFRTATVDASAAHRVAPPAPGTPGDPTVGGGMLRIFNSAGSGEQLTVVLPAARWRATRSGYIFHSHKGAISRIRVKHDRITIRGGRSAFTYTLDEPAQRRMAVRLTLGQGVDWCFDVAPESTDPSSDQVDRFDVQDAPAPQACPAPPVP